MSSPPPRRRRHSPAVYRRRRLVVLLVLIALVAGIWLLIAQPWRAPAQATDAADLQNQQAQPVLPVVSSTLQPGDEATPTQSPTTAPSGKASTPPAAADASATPTPDPSASAAPCSTDNLTVTAVTDKTSYASGQEPKLSIELANTGPDACTLNVGTSAQTFTITSGDDTWWRSTDCQTEPSDMIVVLEAGQKVSSAQPIVWDRTRSSVATCEAKNRPRAPGGGATYHLSVSIGGAASIDDALFQLY